MSPATDWVSDCDRLMPWLALADLGWLWLAMASSVGPAWLWQCFALVGYGWLRPAPAGSGWLWLAVAGSGWR